MSLSVRCFVVFALAAFVASQGDDLDPDLLKEIFGTPLENITVVPTTGPTTIVDDETGDSCVCVPYYLCEPAGNTVSTDGKYDGFGKIDIRFKPESCQVSIEVCCKAPRDVDNPVEPVEVPERLRGCGVRNEKGVDFQLLSSPGNESEFGEFPWTVAILNVADSSAVCAGSLIHPSVVLTGAHCLAKLRPLEIKIRAGEWDTQTTKERLPFQERNADRFLLHPKFNAQSLANDVALIFLKEPVVLADNVNTVCLPTADNTFNGAKGCFGTGWGKLNFGKADRYAVIMKKVELDTVEFATCQRQFQKTRLGPKFKLHSTFLCAGGVQGRDTCKGDGGGPLVCPSQAAGRYLQAGIVAWGIGCGEKDVPAAYGHVAKFRSWIDQSVQAAGLETAPYTLV